MERFLSERLPDLRREGERGLERESELDRSLERCLERDRRRSFDLWPLDKDRSRSFAALSFACLGAATSFGTSRPGCFSPRTLEEVIFAAGLELSLLSMSLLSLLSLLAGLACATLRLASSLSVSFW